MVQGEFVISAIPVLAGVIIVMEMFFYFQVRDNVYALQRMAIKAAAVLAASKISDHWKEKVLPGYAARILNSTLKISYILGLLVISFGIVYGLIGMLVFESLPEGLERLLRLDMQCIVFGFSITYGILRNRVGHG